MTRVHETLVQDQFGPRADLYVQSAVHATGADLDAIAAIARREAPLRALDLGAGGGHVAYALAAHAGAVVAADLSPDMLKAVERTALERGLANIETQVAAAEALPFADGAFDFLASRFSAHHWRDLDAGLRQARRVLKPGAAAVFVDVVSPGTPALDTHLQTVELLRDPSHIRDYTAAEWHAALARAGFGLRGCAMRRLRMEYQVWVDRMRTDVPHRAAIRSLQQQAARDVTHYFEIEPDGSFTIDSLQMDMIAL